VLFANEPCAGCAGELPKGGRAVEPTRIAGLAAVANISGDLESNGLRRYHSLAWKMGRSPNRWDQARRSHNNGKAREPKREISIPLEALTCIRIVDISARSFHHIIASTMAPASCGWCSSLKHRSLAA
jgi:hypothetical protein